MILLKGLLSLSLVMAGDPQLQSLRNTEVIALQKLLNSGEPQLFLLFQPGCGSCRKQVKDLECLAPQTKITLIGSFAPTDSLRREVRRMSVPFPAFAALPTTVQEMGFQMGLTPQILWRRGEQRRLLSGYFPCSELKKGLGL